PRPRHHLAVRELLLTLGRWLSETGAGEILASPADIALGEDEILQPDLFVIPPTTPFPPQEWSDVRELLLAIEVVSPGSARYDRQLKRRRYQRARVPEYWVVDPQSRIVERWRPDDERPEILDERL